MTQRTTRPSPVLAAVRAGAAVLLGALAAAACDGRTATAPELRPSSPSNSHIRMSFSGPLLAEGDGGTTAAVFTITANTSCFDAFEVGWRTEDGTAKAGEDYQAASGRAYFPAGARSATVTVQVNGDTELEPDETFRIVLNGTFGSFACIPLSFSSTSATATIQNDEPTDASPPSIEAEIAGTEGDDGWYVSDVEISWTIADTESELESTTGCDAVTVTSNTAGTDLTCTATSAGGTASATVTVKRDATPPTLTGAPSGTEGLDGWYTSPVSIAWTAEDDLSGVAPFACVEAAAADTGGTTLSCEVKDEAGNAAEASVSFRIDATAPEVAFSGPTAYTVDQTVAIVCSATDATSGVASSTCPGASGAAYSFGPSGSLNATATDRAGNSSEATTSFSVSATPASLCTVVRAVVSSADVAAGLCDKLAAIGSASARGNDRAKAGPTKAFQNQVDAQTGKAISAADAAMLLRWLATL